MTGATCLKRRMRTSYDRIAVRYARINAHMPAMVAESAMQFWRLLGPAAFILDLGCGHGRDLAWFRMRGMRGVGVDLSPGMLHQARERADAPLLLMDMRRLGAANGAFDGIWCNAALLHLPKDEVSVALSEAQRVLKHSGLFFASFKSGYGEGWEPRSYGEPVERFFAFYGKAEIRNLMMRAGFSILEETSSAGIGQSWVHILARSH
jgi:ubiquinone/menaquinone biosynthesis C-methylase UbiE